MGAVRKAKKGEGFVPPPPNPEELQAVKVAAEKLREFFPGHAAPDSVVYAIVSAWIVERVKLSIGRILCGEIAYSLGDAHLRGSLEALLPQIGSQLSHLPSDKPFFELSKEQVIDVLAIGFHAGHHSGAYFDDEIPFP